jgi:hypothetical protein
MFTKHNPHGGGIQHLNNTALEQCIFRHQQGDPNALGEIVTLIQPRAETLIRFFDSARYSGESELFSDIHHKLVRSVDKFNAQRGSAFSFISCLIENELRSSVMRARRRAERHVTLDEEIANQLVTRSDIPGQEAVDHLIHHIKATAKTTLSNAIELSAQRWLLASFCEAAFQAPRHVCADACMSVFGIGHSRSRELFDLSMVETRRIVFDHLPRRPLIQAARLLGTRAQWALRYVDLLSPAEFDKFFRLSHGLSPFIVVLIDPQSRSRRLDRNPQIGRQNLLWVINGHPDAVPLFSM